MHYRLDSRNLGKSRGWTAVTIAFLERNPTVAPSAKAGERLEPVYLRTPDFEGYRRQSAVPDDTDHPRPALSDQSERASACEKVIASL